MKVLQEINYFYYHMALYELQEMNENDYYKGLSYNSLLYINVISQIRDCTVSKISDALRVTKSAVTLKINELEKQGVISKKQSETDRRIFYLFLTPYYEKTIGIYDAVFAKIEDKLKLNYTENQLVLFGEILHTISSYEWRDLKIEGNE